MNKPVPFAEHSMSALFQRLQKQAKPFAKGIWGRLGLILVVVYILLHKDISIDLEFQNLQMAGRDGIAASAEPFSTEPRAVKAASKEKMSKSKGKSKPSKEDNLANTFSNLGFDDEESSAEQREVKRRKKLAYVKQYAAYAQEEMKKNNIPASITLAQGLLESNAGESRLAVDNNNHFGIKCFSRSCKKGHCTNYTDDTHKDFFRKYKNPSDSFKAHSALLKGDRYQFLYKYRKNDFESWAKGLKKAGYATDPGYDEKLINLILDLELDQYDR